jgi:23S rRNA (adenine2503-C2)-methyltransferase
VLAHARQIRKGAPADLLASHDLESLTEALRHAGGGLYAAKSAAARALKHAFRSPTGPGRWDEASLRALGIGAWAIPALLALDPTEALTIEARAPAADGSERLVLRARDGALIETVILPGPRRTTLCLSSQVGCARGCAFCETGKLGLSRQLTSGEMIDQVRIARALLARTSREPELRNVVFMGMGEPFDNLRQVLRAIGLLTCSHAFAVSPSHVTVSTVGVADKLDAFFAATRAELAVSLNAPDDVRRSAIMPINARFPLGDLKAALIKALPRGRKVLLEYVLFDAWNDAPEDADLVVEFTRGLSCRVNVIACNPGPDPSLRPPTPERLEAFVLRLVQQSVTTLVRRPRGRDVGGGCGQLAGARRLPIV